MYSNNFSVLGGDITDLYNSSFHQPTNLLFVFHRSIKVGDDDTCVLCEDEEGEAIMFFLFSSTPQTCFCPLTLPNSQFPIFVNLGLYFSLLSPYLSPLNAFKPSLSKGVLLLLPAVAMKLQCPLVAHWHHSRSKSGSSSRKMLKTKRKEKRWKKKVTFSLKIKLVRSWQAGSRHVIIIRMSMLKKKKLNRSCLTMEQGRKNEKMQKNGSIQTSSIDETICCEDKKSHF